MARVWIEDRKDHADYKEGVRKAKKAGRTPPGRYRVRWYDPNGDAKSAVRQRKGEAEDLKTEIESKMLDGTYRDPAAARIKVREVAESWFAAQLHLKRSSNNRYREVLDVYVIPRWGNTAIGQVTFEAVAEWLGEIASKPGAKGRKLGASQIKSIHRVFHMVMEWAIKSGRIVRNPAKKVPLPRLIPPDHVYLDHLEVEALANAAGNYRVFVLLLAYTGLRFGEASALKVGRIDLVKKRAYVIEAYGDDNGELYLDTPKDHERRAVPLPDFLVAELRQFIAGRGAEELLFSAPRTGPLRAHNFRSRVFTPAVKAARIPKTGLTPHKLRHTAASLSIAAGADVKVVQTMLGHKTATMTLDTYGHLWPDRLDEVSTALDRRRAEELAKQRSKAQAAPADDAEPGASEPHVS